MPSFIGSSFIPGNYNSRGLTGITGATGNTGNIGLVGITRGNTGATGSRISNITSILSLDEITFRVSDNSSYSLRGFTGATGYWFNSIGVCAEVGNTAFSPFYRVNGMTFEFRGVSAGTNATITADDTFITVTINAADGSYGLSGFTGYVPYISGNTLSASKIYVDSNNVLNFGITGNPTNNPNINPLFADFSENMTVINSNSRTDPSGGYQLDLSQSSIYWLNTPVGITSFINGVTASGVRQEYTFFINGSVVWNLPKNLYFSNDEYAGIKESRFLDGINILQIWSDNGGNTYNASIISKGIGTTVTFNRAEWGSCCQSGQCRDNVLKTECLGSFKSLIPCTERTDCSALTFTESVTGSCCCGITGCIDSTNAPAGVLVTETWCRGICGAFKPSVFCGSDDKGAAYQARQGSNGNQIIGTICPNGCADPVTCCVGGVATQETEDYCVNVLGGIPIVGRSIQDVLNDGGCSSLLEPGVCRNADICTDNVFRKDCNCGTFYTGTNRLTTCQADAAAGGADSNVSLNTVSISPEIKIIHSVNPVTATNTITTYTNDITDPSRTTFIQYELTTPGSVVKKYRIGGTLQIKDLNVARNIDIWNTSSCISFTVRDAAGNIINQNTILDAPTTFTISVAVNTADCSTEFSQDIDFSGVLNVVPISCVDGPITTAEKQVPFIYTRSPCKCIAVGSGSKGTTGDILNKLAITIPFTATRYCTHCTNLELSGYAGSELEYNMHIPYPLKTQTGFISFCPPTTTTVGAECALPEYWCINYGRINELSGCTYSSLFDMNNDLQTIPGSMGTDWNGNTVTVPETNIAPTGCYHLEYNEINILDNPTQGTTYWFTGDWDGTNFESPASRATRGNIRTCTSACKIRVPTYCSTSFDQSSCSTDLVSHCCKTCPGYPKFIGNDEPACDPAQGGEDQFCIDYQPYFNIVRFDPDVLNNISNTYGYRVDDLQYYLGNQILNYGTKPGSPIPYNRGNLFNPLKQETQEVYNAGVDTLPGVDPDDKAKASCSSCSNRFETTQKIQIPFTDETSFASETFDVYGIVISKETTCTNQGSYSSGRDEDCMTYDPATGRCTTKFATPRSNNCNTTETIWYENKYYIIVIQNKNDGSAKKMGVYDIGSTTTVNRSGVNSQYEASCGGGSMLCDTDCGNGAQLKEFKWFGTLTNSASRLPIGFCPTSKKLRYTIKKRLEGIVPNGTGLFSLDSVIEFKDGVDDGTVIYSQLLEASKKSVLGNMLKNIFGKEKTDDYLAALYTICSTDDGSSSCTVNIVPELIEFIGKDCYLQGFDPATGSFDSFTISYNNTNNVNEISLVNSNGTPKNVWWLQEHETFRIASSNDGSYPWIIGTPSSTLSLNNFYVTAWNDFFVTSKYSPFDNANNTTIGGSEQSCGLRTNMLDNRFLKNHNISYLEINSEGFITKRKLIYENPEPGITLHGVVYASGSGKTGPMEYGRSYDSTNVLSWHSDYLFLSESCLPTIPSNGRLVKAYIPKLDLNRNRPVTKIDWARIVKPNRINGERDYKLLVKFTGSRTFGSGVNNVGYLKFLYKTPSNNILDVTPLVRYSMSLNGVFSFTTPDENANTLMNTWDEDHSEYWVDLGLINNYMSTNNGNNNFKPVIEGTTTYLYHDNTPDVSPIYFTGIHTGNVVGVELSTRLKNIITANPELCDDITNCNNTTIHNQQANFNNPPQTPTGLAKLFEEGKIYVLLKEEFRDADRMGRNKTNERYHATLRNYYSSWERSGYVPRRVSFFETPTGDNRPFAMPFGDPDEITMYPNGIDDITDISLCDFALSRIIPIESGVEPEALQITESTESLLNNNVKGVKIDGVCTSIDCTNIADICNELESC